MCGTYDGYLSVIVGTGQMFVRFHSDAGTSQNIGFSAIYRVSGEWLVVWDVYVLCVDVVSNEYGMSME